MCDHCPTTARARVLRALSRYAQTALTPEQVHTTKLARAVVRVVPGFDPRAGPLGPWPRTTIRGCGRLLGAKAAAAADADHACIYLKTTQYRPGSLQNSLTPAKKAASLGQPRPRRPWEATHSTDDARRGGIVPSALPAAHEDFAARRGSSASSRTTSSVTVSVRWVHARARRRDGRVDPAHPVRIRVRSSKIPAYTSIYRRAPRPPLLCVFP